MTALHSATAEQDAADAGARYLELDQSGDLAGQAQWALEHESLPLHLVDPSLAWCLHVYLAYAHMAGGRAARSFPHSQAALTTMGPPADLPPDKQEPWGCYSLLFADAVGEVGIYGAAWSQLDLMEDHLRGGDWGYLVVVRRLALHWLGGRFEEAEEDLAGLMSSGRPDVDPYVALHAGLLRRERGDLAGALEIFDRVSRDPATPPYTSLLRADLLARLHRAPEARSELDAGVAALPVYDEFLRAYAPLAESRVLQAEGQTARAMQVAVDASEALLALGVRPYVAEARWLAGQIAAASGETDSARWWLTSALDLYRHLEHRDHVTMVERDLTALG